MKWRKDVNNLARAAHARWSNDVFLGLLDLKHPDDYELGIALQAVAIQLEAAAKREDDREAKRRQQRLRAQLSDRASGLQRACRLLRPLQAAAISTLKAKDGAYTCDPLEIDSLIGEV